MLSVAMMNGNDCDLQMYGALFWRALAVSLLKDFQALCAEADGFEAYSDVFVIFYYFERQF